MSGKSYEKKCARLVQEALEVPYTRALQYVRVHIAQSPGGMTPEARALAIVDGDAPSASAKGAHE